MQGYYTNSDVKEQIYKDFLQYIKNYGINDLTRVAKLLIEGDSLGVHYTNEEAEELAQIFQKYSNPKKTFNEFMQELQKYAKSFMSLNYDISKLFNSERNDVIVDVMDLLDNNSSISESRKSKRFNKMNEGYTTREEFLNDEDSQNYNDEDEQEQYCDEQYDDVRESYFNWKWKNLNIDDICLVSYDMGEKNTSVFNLEKNSKSLDNYNGNKNSFIHIKGIAKIDERDSGGWTTDNLADELDELNCFEQSGESLIKDMIYCTCLGHYDPKTKVLYLGNNRDAGSSSERDKMNKILNTTSFTVNGGNLNSSDYKTIKDFIIAHLEQILDIEEIK